MNWAATVIKTFTGRVNSIPKPTSLSWVSVKSDRAAIDLNLLFGLINSFVVCPHG